MNDYDPVAFGRLQATVESLHTQIAALAKSQEAMSDDLHSIMRVAERGRGALWMVLTVGGVLGAIANWVVSWFKP